MVSVNNTFAVLQGLCMYRLYETVCVYESHELIMQVTVIVYSVESGPESAISLLSTVCVRPSSEKVTAPLGGMGLIIAEYEKDVERQFALSDVNSPTV